MFSHAFRAYYLPYVDGKTKRMHLGDQASYFFTDKINGCTFAAGVGGGNAPLVVHTNKLQANGEIDQTRMDAKINAIYGTQAHRQLSQLDYISPETAATKSDPNAPVVDTQVTVIGIRTNNQWNFYFQRRNYLGVNGYRFIDTGSGYTLI